MCRCQMFVIFAATDCRATSRRCTSTGAASDAVTHILWQVCCSSVCVSVCHVAWLLASPPTILLLSRWTSVSQKERRACSRGDKRVGDGRGLAILSGSRSWTFACLLVLAKPAYTLRTLLQGLTVWPLLSTAFVYARVVEYEALHARTASKGLALRRVQRARGGRSGGELVRGVEE